MKALSLVDLGLPRWGSGQFALLIAALSLLGCGDGTDGGQSQELELRVTTVNLRNKEDWWEDRIPLLAAELAAGDADIVGMQEVSTPEMQLEVLLAAAATADPSLGYESELTLKPEPYATLTGEALATVTRFPIVETDKKFLQEGRVASFTRVDVGEGNFVDLYNTHLFPDGNGADIRAAQIEDILEMLAEHDDGWPSFFTGDFNGTSDEAWYGLVEDAGFVDAYGATHGDAANSDGATSPVILAREPTEQDFKRRIDFVFFRRGDRVESSGITNSEVSFDTPAEDGLYPSDHLGVTADFLLVFP
jgi:endonuclease/exonuclease/phosphatase family metal-dependent hydrolase